MDSWETLSQRELPRDSKVFRVLALAQWSSGPKGLNCFPLQKANQDTQGSALSPGTNQCRNGVDFNSRAHSLFCSWKQARGRGTPAQAQRGRGQSCGLHKASCLQVQGLAPPPHGQEGPWRRGAGGQWGRSGWVEGGQGLRPRLLTWKALLANPRPSCRQTTMASTMPQFSPHTVPHTRDPFLSVSTSTRPS